MLSHGNIVADLRGSLARVPSNTAHQALSVLPLPHVLERTLSYGYFHEGVRIAYGDPHDLKELLPIHRPDIVGVVPRILEKVKEAVEAQIALLAPHRRWIAGKLIKAAVARARGDLHAGAGRRFLRKGYWRLWRTCWSFRKYIASCCGFKYFISGGAWLNPDVELFFQAAGFDVLQGYGMTETSPVITLNEYHREKIGSVGRALDGSGGAHQRRWRDSHARSARDARLLQRRRRDPPGIQRMAGCTQAIWAASMPMELSDHHRPPQGDPGSIQRQERACAPSGTRSAAQRLYPAGADRGGRPQVRLRADRGASRKCGAQPPPSTGLAFGSYDELLLAPPVVALFRKELESLQAEFSSFERVKRFCFLNEEASAGHRTGDAHPESAPRRAGTQIRRVDRADVPAGRSAWSSRKPEQVMSAGSYRT